ncbi:MAG: hypothetical protein QOK29_1702 [Rhodospirillaceae bacterium]|jgi:hypothetical protein|nr:hypothetical protein [Rhodospirillaceae bacterium]
MYERRSGSALYYRCYLLGEGASIIRAHELNCMDDDEAMQRAIAWLELPANLSGTGVEVWQTSRRVLLHLRNPVVHA